MAAASSSVLAGGGGFANELQAATSVLTSLVAREEERLKKEREELAVERTQMSEQHQVKVRKLEGERKAFDEEKKAAAAVCANAASKIKLDVGGTHYATSTSTLCRFPGSMLEAMFSGRHEVDKDEDGRVFIDRDGSTFRYVLEFLRSPEAFSIEDLPKHEARACETEFDYYGLPMLRPKRGGFELLPMSVCPQNNCAKASGTDDCVIVSHNSLHNDWSWVVSAQPIPDDCVWKVTVSSLKGSTLMMGIVANGASSLKKHVFQDSTFAGWYSQGHFYAKGSSPNPPSAVNGWPGWATGDEGIFRLDAKNGKLALWLKRTGHLYTYSELGGATGTWRIAFATNIVNTELLLTHPTWEEAKSV